MICLEPQPQALQRVRVVRVMRWTCRCYWPHTRTLTAQCSSKQMYDTACTHPAEDIGLSPALSSEQMVTVFFGEKDTMVTPACVRQVLAEGLLRKFSGFFRSRAGTSGCFLSSGQMPRASNPHAQDFSAALWRIGSKHRTRQCWHRLRFAVVERC